MVNKGIPDRWLPYSPMGSIIPGTRFIACKVPLKDALLRTLPEKERFGTKDLLEAFPKIGMLVDLTNTMRYYSAQDFTDQNIRYEKIFCPGQVVPPNSIIKRFYEVVDDYLATADPDGVIVVHCTHGVNRTGYFICRYMIERLNMSPEEAVTNFQKARGHDIERDTYVNDLKTGCKGGSERDIYMIPGRGSRRGADRNERNRKSSYDCSYNRSYNRFSSKGRKEAPEKRRRINHNKNYNDDPYNGQSRNNKRSSFNDFDTKHNSGEASKLFYNWRSNPFTTPASMDQESSHEGFSRSPHEPPNLFRRDHATYQQMGSSRPSKNLRGDSHTRYNFFPKFPQAETFNEGAPSSSHLDIVDLTNSPDKSYHTLVGNSDPSSERGEPHRGRGGGGYRGRGSGGGGYRGRGNGDRGNGGSYRGRGNSGRGNRGGSRSRGNGGGYRGRGNGDRGFNKWKRGDGPQSNNYS